MHKLNNSDNFKTILQNHCIYKSQAGEFKYCHQLKKGSSVPLELKKIYNTIFSTKEKQVKIEAELFDEAYCVMADTQLIVDPVTLGSQKIMGKIQESGYYFNTIEKYEHKDVLLDIISLFEDKDAGNLWKTYFPDINRDLPSLLIKLVLNKDTRDSLIKIMKVELNF